MKLRWNNAVQRCFSVVSTSATDVVSTLCNIENPTSGFVSFWTSHQRCFHTDPQCWNNVDPTLKCLLELLSSSFLAHLLKSSASISQYLYHVIQKKYYASISQNFFFTKALCEGGSLKFQNFALKWMSLRRIDYDKNMTTKIANNDTFGAFTLIFLQVIKGI